MEKRSGRGFSSFAATAVLSIAALVMAAIWTTMPHAAPQVITVQDQPDANAAYVPNDLVVADPLARVATSSDTGLSPLGDAVLSKVVDAYSSLTGGGTYSEDSANDAAQVIAQTLQPVVQAHVYSALDIKTTSDTSLTRILSYRSDLRDALAPLLNITEPEYATYGRFVQSHDASFLVALQHDADLYRAAASSTQRVVVPFDALSNHLSILNAMEGFAATLDALATHANDPFASAALLRTYNQGEEDMLTSFNSLAQYYRAKAGATASTTRS